jgi:hypothetical protein
MNATSVALPHATSPSVHAWLEIPRLAARLLWRHWPALLFWFFVQRVAYDLLLDSSVWLSARSLLLAYASLALLVVTQLVATIAMFIVLRPSLPPPAQRGALPTAGTSQPWVNGVAVALLPFFAYYATWGLLDGLRVDFRIAYLRETPVEQAGAIRDILSLHGLWIALLVAWVVRKLCHLQLRRSGNALWSLLATVCDAYWVFVGVAAIAKLVGLGKDWWHERVVYVAVAQWWENPFALYHLLPAIKRVLVPAWDFATTAAGGIVLPLVWLAITAIVYGLDLRKQQRIDGDDASLRKVGARYRAMPALARHFAGKVSQGWTSKGVPLVNSLRLVLRAGLPALLVLCVCYQLLQFIDAWAFRMVMHAVGPREPAWWDVIGQPVALLFNTPLSLRPALFTELARIALLAATFGSAMARLPRNATSPATVTEG